MKRRFVGLVVGLLYAMAWGFFTVMATGGGHGNFLWFFAFLFTFFFGLFFPAAGFLVSDLKPTWARAGALSLLVSNLVATVAMFLTGFSEEIWQDVYKSWQRNSTAFIIVSGLHCLPVLILWVVTVRSVWKDIKAGDFD